jgi:transketolase
VRNAFAEALYQYGKKDPRVFIAVADISPAGSMAKFREEFPERFINVGVAEQVMIGLCAGLALKGCRPFAYTIATFSLYRPFEMIRDDLCYQNLPVTVVGIGGGVIYSTLGGTHHAQEDIAIAGALPNMSVLAPCDPLEARECVRWSVQTEKRGPLYLRLGKAGEPTLTADAIDPWEFGKIRTLRSGTDVAILSYGVVMAKAADLADRLAKQARSVSLINVHTLKPLDREGIARVLAEHDSVIVLEEHAPQGGLASQVKQIAWDEKATCTLRTYTLQDEFIHLYGSHDELLAAHGIDVAAMASSAG